MWAAVADRFTGTPDDPAPAATAQAPAVRPPGGDDFSARLSAEVSRHPVRLAAACLATVLGPVAVARSSPMSISAAAGDGPAGGRDRPIAAKTVVTPPGPGDLTAWRVAARGAADTCPGLPPALLVAIGRAESDLGTNLGPSTAGALGPMQFMPPTWAAYASDGDGDGLLDVMNAADALYGAARFLCANGAGDPARLGSAIWHYNHSDAYVARVLALAGAEESSEPVAP